MLPPPEDDLANRLPVWMACGDLYLDTEITDQGYHSIARACAASPYTSEELDRIMFSEVWPALALNLFSVAGEWAGWDEEFVKIRILERSRRRWRLPWMLKSLKRPFVADWDRVHRMVDEIRAARGAES